jgi:hypothetical protein
LPKKVSKEGAPEMAQDSLNFRNRAEKVRNSPRLDSSPSFFRPLKEIQGVI